MPTITDSHEQLKHGKRLTEAQKRAIVAAVAVKGSMQLVAQEFNVHRNTVAQLVNSVRNTVQHSEFSGDWRSAHKAQAVQAVTDGLTSSEDPVKRGMLGVTVLKGLGEYAGDNQTQVTVMLNSVSSLPADLAQDYLEIEATHPPTQQDSDTLEP